MDNIQVINLVQEHEASRQVKETFDRIKKGFQINFVPNFFKAQATRPELLEVSWNTVSSILIEGLVPRAIKEMMFTAISKANNCKYCEAAHLAFCKVLGVDKKTREDLVRSISSIRPLRTRDIIQFSVKVGTLPTKVIENDYQTLRDHGISIQEMQEIVAMSSFASYANIIADGLRVPIDQDFYDILED